MRRSIDRLQVSTGALLGSLLLLALAAVIVAAQPLRSPWWINADPDGAYVGSSLNILLGNHTGYLDHPGLATQDALAIAFEGKYLVEKATGDAEARQTFVDEQFLDLDGTRPIYRTWAILLYLGSVALAFACCARLFGHWTWGLAGGLLILAAPGIPQILYVLRPDAALSGLCLAIGYLMVTAFERRSAARYAAAAALLGLTMMVKLTAVGLAAPLFLAAAWRPARRDWHRDFARTAATAFRRHRLWIVPAAAMWIGLCITFNRDRLPVLTNADQRHVLAYGGTFLGGFLACTALAEGLRLPWANRVFSSFNSLLLIGFTAGLALPATLVLDDGIQAVVAIWQSLTGKRVNENVDAFSQFSWSLFNGWPLHQAGFVMALALIAALVGAWRRDFRPALLALGVVILATMAAARNSYDYYYAPAFAVAIPAALWVLRRRHDRLVPVHAWLFVLLVLVPTFRHLDQPRSSAPAVNRAAQRLADTLLKPGEVILVPHFFGVEDVAFDTLVDSFVDYVPPSYPYRFLEPGSPRIAERQLTPRYYVDSAAAIEALRGAPSTQLADGSTYRLRPLPIRWGPGQRYGIAEIVGQ